MSVLQCYEANSELVFTFEASDRALLTTLDACFADLRSQRSANLRFDMQRTATKTATRVRVAGEPELVYPDSLLLEELVSLVNRRALDSEPGRLHLHAAGLSRRGHGVVLAGTSGTGKSTLTAALVRNGFTYMSDESVAIEPSAEQIHGFPKPITLRRGGAALVGDDAESVVSFGVERPDRFQLPASAIGGEVARSVAPSILLFLSRTTPTPEDATLDEISSAEAVVELLGHTQDFDRFGPQALATLAELSTRSSCHRLRIGSLESTVAAIRQLTDASPPRANKAVHVQRLDNHGPTENLVLGGEAVLRNHLNGKTVHLPRLATEAWLDHLAGKSGPHSKRLTRELIRLGLVTEV